uniref:SP140 nuclear body protein n=1 Tax=Rhinolophus ferrumequinum TaxID=59479 RepID=A0A671F885_RHIFE
MAGEGSNLNYRMVTGDEYPEDQSPEEQLFYEFIFSLFRENKVEIASAITKPFPLLMGLRDRGYIPEQMYEHFQEACRNLVPVERVVYDVLSELEKTFDKTVLDALFSKVNLKAYPDLLEICRNFQNVIHENFHYQLIDDEETKEMLNFQLSCEQGDALPRARIPEHLSDGQQMTTRKEESSHGANNIVQTQELANECAQESQQEVSRDHRALERTNRDDSKEMPKLLPDLQMDEGGKSEEMPVLLPYDAAEEDGSACLEPCDEEELQEFLSSPPSCGSVSCDPEGPQMTEELEEVPSQRLCVGEVSVELEAPQSNTEGDSEVLNPSLLSFDGQDVPGGSEARPECSPARDTTDTVDLENNSTLDKPKRKRKKKKGHSWSRNKRKWQSYIHQKGTKLSTRGKEKCSCVMCFSQDSLGDTVALGNSSTLGNLKRKTQEIKKWHSWSRNKRKWPRNIHRRGSRNNREVNVNFRSQILPVTCGEVKGMLYKKKLKQGIHKKCIQSEDGNWFTPREFEVEGGHARAKYWKLSVRCGGRPLKWLIEEGFLRNPPRIYRRRKKRRILESPDPCARNSDVCEICLDGGTLFCCDTCSRSFHEDCHLPPVETERSPWSCTFCRTEAFLGNQECHRESEVLERQMGPKEQLKCEFLLLKIYSHSESSFFAKIPYYYYDKESSKNIKEPMWLDKITKRLKERSYPQVEGFVQDMRLIFQNHKASYKYNDFGLMGIRLEKEFEKNFKEVFAIQDTNENSSDVVDAVGTLESPLLGADFSSSCYESVSANPNQ